jgi:hypothetical protein
LRSFLGTLCSNSEDFYFPELLSNPTPHELHSKILPPGSSDFKLSLPQLGHFNSALDSLLYVGDGELLELELFPLFLNIIEIIIKIIIQTHLFLYH